jgi:hypothetical protein
MHGTGKKNQSTGKEEKNIDAHALRNASFQASTNMIAEELFQAKFVPQWGWSGETKTTIQNLAQTN